MLIRFILTFVLVLTHITAQACWPLNERKNIDGFAELDGVLILSFKDAVNCKAINNAQVFIGDKEYTSDETGYVEIPMDPYFEMMDERFPLKVIKPGYITLQTELIVAAGTVLNRKQVLSKALPEGKLRFVLQWEDKPKDLDLHLKGPDFHISYRNMKNVPNKAKLDHDEVEGYGPETITLERLSTNASYSLWVDVYSNEGVLSGHENALIYSGDQLVKKIQLPSTSKRGVHILDIVGGSLEIINQPGNRP